MGINVPALNDAADPSGAGGAIAQAAGDHLARCTIDTGRRLGAQPQPNRRWPEAQRRFGLLRAGQRTTRHHIASGNQWNEAMSKRILNGLQRAGKPQGSGFESCY